MGSDLNMALSYYVDATESRFITVLLSYETKQTVVNTMFVKMVKQRATITLSNSDLQSSRPRPNVDKL